MQKFLSTLTFVVLFTIVALAQGAIDIHMTVSDNAGGTLPVRFGLDPTATAGIDPLLGESDLPPLPPTGVYDVRFLLAGGLSTLWDYRNAPAFPYTGNVQHQLQWQFTTGGNAITISYDFPVGAEVTFIDPAGGGFWNSGPRTGSGSFVITPPGFLVYTNVNVVYTNIQPVIVGPGFGISPVAPLDFGNVAFPGGSKVLPVTVSNSGNAPLNLSGIVSSDPTLFTFAPNTFPVIIPVGGNTIFNVTYTPTALGLQTGSLTFTHNAPGSPTVYAVQGTGVTSAPIFAVNPTTLNFGSIGAFTTADLTVTVTNEGVADPLNITSALTTLPEYSVIPPTANIPAGGSQIFTVTFAPLTGGTFNGSLDFIHNAAGSPSSVALTGAATAESGLVFNQETVTVYEDSGTFSDIISLYSLATPLHAIQFRLLVNKSADDNNLVKFHSIEKGTDVANDPNWSLHYEIFRGPLTSNGATLDSVYVLLYNLTQNGNLNPGTYLNLFKVNYSTVDLPALVDSDKTSFRLTEVLGSNVQGLPVNVTPSRDYENIWVKNRVPSLGDVNGDGSIDILDLIMVVDHIIGRDSLETNPDPNISTEFKRADIAPWVYGNTLPTPDGLVNVFDLSIIQNIILTGQYPNGVPINSTESLVNKTNLAKVTDTEAKVILHITERGIAARIESEDAIRGAQLEFLNVTDDASNMTIDSRLEGGYYLQTDDLLRVLLYDVRGNAFIPSGEHFLANMPFEIENPRDIEVDKIILVNTQNQKIGIIHVEISYGNDPALPVDYALMQNYPNPFNPTTMVQFSVPHTDFVNLRVYDMLGQEVRTLFSGQVQMGVYTVQWDGIDNYGVQMSSGTYVYRMTATGFVASKKMVLLK